MTFGIFDFYFAMPFGHRINLTRLPTARKRLAIRDDEEMFIPKPLRDVFANDIFNHKNKDVEEEMMLPRPLANIGGNIYEQRNHNANKAARIVLENDNDVRFYENRSLR